MTQFLSSLSVLLAALPTPLIRNGSVAAVTMQLLQPGLSVLLIVSLAIMQANMNSLLLQHDARLTGQLCSSSPSGVDAYEGLHLL